MIKRIITLSLAAIACLTMQAQTNNDVVTLAKSSGYWVPKPSVAKLWLIAAVTGCRSLRLPSTKRRSRLPVGTGPKRTTGLSLLV